MDSRFANLLEANVEELRRLIVDLPRERILPIASAQAIQQQMTLALAKGDVQRANRAFWIDQAQTLDVWRSIFLWRISEQVEATLLLKSTNQLVAAAAVCRSGFELAVSGLNTSARLFSTLKTISAEDVRAKVIGSHTFPDDLDLAIFGTRISKLTKEMKYPLQKNLLTHLEKLQRHELGGELSSYYELLCDMTHPNLGGNTPFLRRREDSTITGVSQEYDPKWLSWAQNTIDATLSWTAHAGQNVFIQSGETINYVRNKLFEEV